MGYSRRKLLAAAGASSVVGLAGCLGRLRGVFGSSAEISGDEIQPDLAVSCADTTGEVRIPEGRVPTEFDRTQATPTTEYDDGEIPLREEPLYLGHDRSAFLEGDLSGGVGKDGIPSIDEPRFAPTDSVQMPGCRRVFGVEIDGDVRAYPQHVVVRHEIVNDVVGGEPVAMTYCPLTGTAQGFFRGGVEFGVSGRLVNSNLIMWDRTFDVRWPQIAATGLEVGSDQRADGADRFIGESLSEFRVIWTTYEQWTDRHPDTLVMTESTGLASNYNRDPYGSYTPVSGHYATGAPRRPEFPLLVDSAEIEDEKRVVIGARTTDGAIAFDKRTLIEDDVLTGTVGDTPVVAVADHDLTTGHVYANPEEHSVSRSEDGYRVDGETHAPDELGLEPIVAFDAMWFAWLSFYPETERVGAIP